MEINNKKYITGVFRGDNGNNMVTHLYTGSFEIPDYPMCSRGWQRKQFDKNGKLEDWEFSIFRNNLTNKGICKICQKRAEKDLPPFISPYKTLK
jgi:hypothetical protein